jgi:hypothetical protein
MGKHDMSVKPALLFAVVTLWCLTGVAAESRAQQQTTHGTTIVVQLSYYAKPGREQDVLSIRLSACDVLEKNSITRGRVLTRSDSPRATKNADNPDVVWEGEFPDAASLSRYEEIADKDPDFIAVRQKMNAATRITERRYYQLH